MSKFSDLPVEIWLLIASYVPESQLYHLKSLNSFFLDHWMDIKWKSVEIDTQDTAKAVPLLLRLLDSFVTTRVKSLTLFIGIITESPSMPLLLSFISLLSRTTSLNIDISRRSSATAFIDTLFGTVASSPLARTLQRLQIRGIMVMFASQVPSAHAFENLTNLSLSLFDWEHSGLLEGTFPLRLLAPALHTLQIANWSGILDPFIYFNTLTFLNLKSLIIIFAIPPHRSLSKILTPIPPPIHSRP